MTIKNYTSEMPVEKSMGKIEKNLVAAGGRKIMKEYNDSHVCTAISFQLPVNDKILSFQLPANVDAIYKLLISEYTRPTERSFEICRAQSERTVWKLISDWVEVQISMIKLEQAEILQVFLPYLHDGKQSFFEKCVKSDFKLLEG